LEWAGSEVNARRPKRRRREKAMLDATDRTVRIRKLEKVEIRIV